MPASSTRQLVISATLQHAHHLQAQYHQQRCQLHAQYDPSDESSSSNYGSQSSSECSSATSASTSSISSGSNSHGESTDLSDLVSEDSNDATDQVLNTLHQCYCYLLLTYRAWSFVALLLSTC